MAVEVVKRGELPGNRKYKGTCGYCQTQIKCIQSDGKLVAARDQRDGDRLEVKCPVCAKNINAYADYGTSYMDR